MSNFGDHPAGFFGDSSFYNGAISTSYRNDNASDAYLYGNKGGNGDRQKFTISWWMKIGTSLTGTIYTSGYSGSGGSASSGHIITSSNKVRMQNQVNNSAEWTLDSTRLFRDVSAWYNCVLAVDTTQGTEANRIKLYVNGVQETLSGSYPSQNANLRMNNQFEKIGTWDDGGSRYFDFDGYFADFNLIDGTQLDASSFGEFKNGVWIPVDTSSLTRGTKGWRLEFKQVGVGTASSSTVGADTGGNDFHFTSSGIVASDCAMPDSPENNFCTLNSVGRRYGQSYVGTFSEGNLKVASGGNATNVFGTMAINQIASQGGVYFEVRMDSLDTSRTYFGVVGDTGSNNKNVAANAGGYTFPIKGMINNDPRGDFATVTDASVRVDLTANTAFSNGDVAGIAILSDGKFFCHRNGTYLDNASGNTGNPSTGANPIATIDLTLGDWVPYVGYNSTFSVNFGQDGTFSGQETSGGNQDGNGIGDFMFAVPTNCFALCSSNMAEPTISPNSVTQADDHFNTVLYTGNASPATHTIGFRPNWVWGKRRNIGNQNHWWINDVTDIDAFMSSDTTDAEATTAGTTFNATSFTTANNDLYINNNSNYVVWAWKGNGTGTAVSNTDGSINSTVSANTTAGFSIVSFTGNGSNDATIGHGLGTTPAMIITKNRADSVSWRIWHKDLTANNVLFFTTSGTIVPSGHSNGYIKTVGSSTYSVYQGNSDTNGVNGNGDAMVAYCFAEVEGYSKFGSYTGNGNADGTFVYTGFRPAFILFKRTDGAGNSWGMKDIVRDSINPNNGYLFAESNSVEGTATSLDIDFLSNGLKFRGTSSDGNGNGNTYIYMAFAEAPFIYANAR